MSAQNDKSRPEAFDIPNIKAGLYQHYKGNKYWVYEIGLHSETTEPLVIYRCLYGEHSLWVRPHGMFLEEVELGNGERVPRFKFISSKVPQSLANIVFPDAAAIAESPDGVA